MKILLIYPPYRHARVFLPKSLAYVAACLQNAGHRVRVLDTDAFIYTDKQLREKLAEKEYDVVGISALSPAYSFTLRVSAMIKELKPSVKIIAGGHLATYSYDILLKNSLVDFCVVGEGEVTSVELLDALSGKRGLDSVDGIAYKKNGSFVNTSPRQFIHDLDTLPFPAWELFAVDDVYSKNTVIEDVLKAGRHLTVSGTRGCTYACIENKY